MHGKGKKGLFVFTLSLTVWSTEYRITVQVHTELQSKSGQLVPGPIEIITVSLGLTFVDRYSIIYREGELDRYSFNTIPNTYHYKMEIDLNM